MERPATDPVTGPHQTRHVVLVHGLWTPATVMRPIGRWLVRCGYEPSYFRYLGRDDFEANAVALDRFIERLAGPAHYVGHSLGGLLLLRTLGARVDIPIGRTVFIASPVGGAESARRLARAASGRLLLGRAMGVLCTGIEPRWHRRERLGIIVGTGKFGLGRLLGALDGINDGVVREAETRVAGSADTLMIGSAHTPLLLSRRVAEAVAHFLATGRFTPS